MVTPGINISECTFNFLNFQLEVMLLIRLIYEFSYLVSSQTFFSFLFFFRSNFNSHEHICCFYILNEKSYSTFLCCRILEGDHASFVETVPFKSIAVFTLFQFMYLLICFGITWIPIAGIFFPLPFFLLVSIRQRVLPKLFHPQHLQELDASEYEEIAGAPLHNCSLSFRVWILLLSLFFIF